MQRGRGGRGRRAWAGGRGNPAWQGGPDGGMMGGGMGAGMGGGMGGMMGGNMGPGWGPEPMMQGPGMGGPGMMPGPMGPGMMGGGPGMMGVGPGMMPPGGPMMGPPMDAGGPMMPPQFGFNDMGPPMPKRMRPGPAPAAAGAGGGGGRGPGMMGGPMGGGGQLQQQQSNNVQQQQQQQQPKGPGWGVTIANDYCQNFVDTGERPQNFLMDAATDDPLAEYPVQKRLYEAKMDQVKLHQTPPYAIRADLRRLALSQELFGTKFDVILIDPPWEEYVRRAPGFVSKDEEVWTWQQIQDLNIGAISDEPSFVFLWCGCEEGLDAGRHCLARWGFRRIEDICWIKTNKEVKPKDGKPGRAYLSAQHQDPRSTLVHTKEHVLVGMKGKLLRSRDHAFVHANCDTDIICTEEPPLGSMQKPEELYGVIERFCNGRRRLELFGEDHNIRPGWVTVGKNISNTNFRPQSYMEHFKDRDGRPYTTHGGYPPLEGAPVLVPTNDIIEQNRPKSPVMR